MTVRVLVPAWMAREEWAKRIKTDFQKYKETGVPPLHFGRDVPYHIPERARLAEIHHLHIAPEDVPWLPTVRQHNRTSDRHLVYTFGILSSETYGILGLLNDNAHEAAASRNMIFDSLIAAAERFREEY